jgi:hypothetical protein
MGILRRRLAQRRGSDPPNLGPRIALWGTFDIADYGTLLLPRIFERELLSRLPLAQVDVYSPLGYEHPMPMDGGRPALPLGVPSDRRKRQLADRHDLIVVTGDVVHTRDEHHLQQYGLTVEEATSLRPSEFLLDGLGAELERRCPVIWSAARAPFDLSEPEERRVRRALEGRPHLSVRDDRSRNRLLATGTEREIAVVPDPAVLASRHFPDDVLRKRLEYLRVLGCYPSEGRPIFLQSDTAHGDRAADLAHAVAAHFDSGAIVLAEVQASHDDSRPADGTAAELGAVFRLPAHATLEDITAAIANAGVFVGTASSVATAFGVPAFVPVGTPVVLQWVPEAESADLQARVDTELDAIAALAERSWSEQLASDARAPEQLAQALLQSEERYRALLEAHKARGERLVSERMRFAEIVERLEASDGALPADTALRIAELENAVFIAQAAEVEARFEVEQFRNERERSG